MWNKRTGWILRGCLLGGGLLEAVGMILQMNQCLLKRASASLQGKKIIQDTKDELIVHLLMPERRASQTASFYKEECIVGDIVIF